MICRTVWKDGKRQLVNKKYFSVKLLALSDYMLQKSPYWSSSYYDKKVPGPLRTSFIKLVEGQHNQGPGSC